MWRWRAGCRPRRLTSLAMLGSLVACSLLSLVMVVTSPGQTLVRSPSVRRDRPPGGAPAGARRQNDDGGGYPEDAYDGEVYYDDNPEVGRFDINVSQLRPESFDFRSERVKLREVPGGRSDGHVDDDVYDGNADDSYTNRPFKEGDFDYVYNRTFEKQASTGNGRNKYRARQYKSMHLLEKRRANGRNLQKSGRLYAKDEVNNSGSALSSDGGTAARGTDPERARRRPDRESAEARAGGGGRFGYRKDGISYPLSANLPSPDHIETQIPLQRNGDATSLLIQEPPATQIQIPEYRWRQGEIRSRRGVPLIVDRIFWSPEVENLVAQGITDEDYEKFLHKLQVLPVAEMHAPQWNRCGRPNNQYIVLKDGTPLCARYRDEHVKLIHGELLSFSLSRILGLDNVPIVLLSEVDTRGSQWRGMNLSAAGWNESSIVALIQWIDGLDSERSRVKMPAVILEAYEKGSVFGADHQAALSLTANNLTELVQWSDLILFDYLTGHYDRVASMQDGADRERRPSIMHENIRNLRKVWQTGKLWLIDNESGLFDGYELLYRGGEMGRKFVTFHRQMLATNCVFRRQTAHKILELARLPRPDQALVDYTTAQDPVYRKLPYAGEAALFKRYFHVRLKEVADWIQTCRRR